MNDTKKPAASTTQIASLWVEFVALYAGVPLVIVAFRLRVLMLAVLWLGAIGIHLFLRSRHQVSHSEEWNWAGFRAGVAHVLLRFVMLAAAVAIAVWYFTPEVFLSFPRQRPAFWLLVMVLYPVLSVWPQELVYRSFLFHRYRPIVGDGRGYVVASAVAFGYVHLIFLNWIAPVMTLIGGGLFATSYRKHQSLALSCVEHALYGCMVFTVGLGSYFFTGAAWHR
ncbi:MAG TPA: CPBP family intramembrane glutamic endopeptidase [Paraburkholderia sp.]|jgi:hypothetical protein|nr:CPBP family intramembrane glutamic endopeptidase [Paraburkholderia sp.]